MDNSNLNSKIAKSVKWASITEIAIKLITPIVSMLLARILSPEEFGVVATITMIIGFADVFTEAGFPKYIIQHDFKNKEELHNSADVAFWTNLGISICIWLFISLFSESIASIAGNPGYGKVLVVAGISLIITSFSSIQMAILKKEFDFKKLFIARIIGAFVPLVITLPLALLGFSYWALVIGTIASNFVNALVLTISLSWKPRLFFKFNILNEMFSFSMWILVESILLWGTTYIGTFIVGKYLTNYYLGVYKNSISMVNSLMNIVAAATTSVLLSALSVVKNDEKKYNEILYSFQEKVGLLLLPMGCGIFLYRELATNILFGSQWSEASLFVGLYSLVNSITILTGQYMSTVFTSKGRPKLAVFSQLLQLIEQIPLLYLSVRKGFLIFTVACCFSRLLYGFITVVIGKLKLNISICKMIRNMKCSLIGSFAMMIVSYVFTILFGHGKQDIIAIMLCTVVYMITLLLLPSSRNIVGSYLDKLRGKVNDFKG